MMFQPLPVVLTSRDFALLENLVDQWGEPFPGASEIIRWKLSAATVVFPADVDPGVVTLNSRVRFRTASGHTDERTLVGGPSEAVFGLTILLPSPRGVALIGASAGQTVEARRRDGGTEQLFIEAVPYQPERSPARSRLRVVARSDALAATPGSGSLSVRQPAATSWGPDDDPGPSAA
jgi:regulator of nucleoside diphosphate kinase